MQYNKSADFAKEMDRQDGLAKYREQFHIPQIERRDVIYLTGDSLGLQPKTLKARVIEALDDWANLGVGGHFKGKNPWLPYHEFVADSLAALVGATPKEVVAMNSLSIISCQNTSQKIYPILDLI